MTFNINKSDSIGILSSSLCLVHCLITPFLFVAQANSISHTENKPLWWASLGIIFLLISALAIYKSSASVSKKWVAIILWMSWSALLIIICNEKMEWFSIPEAAIYIPSLSLVLFHWYGSMFCQCKAGKCCVN